MIHTMMENRQILYPADLQELRLDLTLIKV